MRLKNVAMVNKEHLPDIYVDVLKWSGTQAG